MAVRAALRAAAWVGLPGGGGTTGASGADALAAHEAKLDDLDTRAFLRAEAVLRPEQREEAREIASDYRAQRYDLRQQRDRSRKKR